VSSDLVIKNATAVTGDGSSVLQEATIYVSGDTIEGVEQRGEVPSDAGEVLDAGGLLVMPGIINCHSHGITPGPIFPSGAEKPPKELWQANLSRHLFEGSTTLLNVCGFALPSEVQEANEWHPINVKSASSHTPKNMEAALIVDGAGLSDAHQAFTVEEAVEAGAVAIGEVGTGHTLGGGGADYMYIPPVFERETGVKLDANQARDLKLAVLGRYMKKKAYDEQKTLHAMEQAGLKGKLTSDRARELIHETVLGSFAVALEGFSESAQLALELGVPALFHNSAPSKETMIDIARKYASKGARLTACHCDHSTFEPEEAVETARILRNEGVVIEVCVGDAFIRRRLTTSTENWDRLFEEGLVEIIGTDYAAGDHDPIPAALQYLVDNDLASIAEAVAMVTANTVRVYTRLGTRRGKLARGMLADITVTNPDKLIDVRHVIISGKQVLRDGVEVWR